MKSNFTNIYFIGIGGIGMSAIARYYNACGYKVAGYDRTRSEVCTNLEKEGIRIHYEDNMNYVGSYFKNPEETLVVYTPAIPANHNELTFFRENNFNIIKRSEALGRICNSKNCIAVAGTHGKTSISTIAAWIMVHTKGDTSAFLGGISKNFNSNLHLNLDSKNVVVEADEFDRSFLQLNPTTALIGSIEADHLDIYGDYETMENTFAEFANKTSHKGALVLNAKTALKLADKINKGIKVYTYGVEDESNFSAKNITYAGGFCIFDIVTPFGTVKEVKYKIGGRHNIENAVGAVALALLNKAEITDVKNALESFNGVVRRFDIRVYNEKNIYIDDYAHHPGEISAFINSVKQIFPTRKLTIVFQPHLYSRTQDLYMQFAETLSNCDKLILLPIYPARELPIEGVTSELIYSNCKVADKQICEKDALLDLLDRENPELLVTMGAGDIDRFVKPITDLLSKK